MNTSMLKHHLRTLVVGALFGAALMFCVAPGTGSSNHTAWEYKVLSGEVVGSEGSPSLQQSLNRAAESGWEFVSTAQAAEHWGVAVMRREKK